MLKKLQYNSVAKKLVLPILWYMASSYGSRCFIRFGGLCKLMPTDSNGAFIATAISTIMPNEKIRGEYIALITLKKPWDCVKTQRLCTCFPYYRGPRMSPMPRRDCLHHLLNAYSLYQRALFGTVERTKKRQRASVYSIRTAAWQATSIDQISFFDNKNPY